MADTSNNITTIPFEKSNTQTKEQKRYESLIKRIEDLEVKLIKEELKITAAIQEYNAKVYPLEQELINEKSVFVFQLDAKSHSFKLSKKQTDTLTQIITIVLQEIFENQEPTPAQEELYDKWSNKTFKEQQEAYDFLGKKMFENFINDVYQGEIDASDFEDTPEGHERMRQRIEEYEEKKEKEFKSTQKSKKPTKRELFQAEVEELKSKNIRSIYIALVKVLHPDTVQDEALKLQKNELMKRVTTAYENNDLPTLLKLEAEWISQTNDKIYTLPDYTLKLYNEVLFERLQELEYKKFELYRNPAFNNISNFIHLNEKRIHSKIHSIEKNYKTSIDVFKYFTSNLFEVKNKNEFVELTQIFRYNNLNFNENDFGYYL